MAGGGAKLVFVSSADRPLDLDPERPRLSLGRHPDSDLVVDDAYASRLHGFLDNGGLHWVFTDTSRYGTTLTAAGRTPEELKGKSRPLRHGDVLLVGGTSLRFHQPSAESSDDDITPPLHAVVCVTPRQMDVLMALARPLIEEMGAAPASNGEIAAALAIGINTLKGLLAELYRRFDVDSYGGTALQKRAELASQWSRARIC